MTIKPDMMITDNTRSPVAPSFFLDKKFPLRITGITPRPESLKTQGSGQRILVVDDEISIADSLAEILSECGYDALALYDGHSAIAATREKCPDTVICDVLMPKLNGIATGTAIRELCPHVRILLFSGQYGTADIIKAARDQGQWFELLPKPIH